MTNTDLSPKSMAEAAYTAAVAQIEQQQDRSKERSHDEIELTRADDSADQRGEDVNAISKPKKLFRVDGEETFSDTRHGNDLGRENDVGARIKEIWKSGDNKPDSNMMAETIKLLTGELDSFVQLGLSAFYDLDATSRQLAQSKELAETKSREAQRLQTIDEQSRASLSNLLRAVESSKAEARDSSRSAQVEARLRNEINSLRDERDKAHTELSGHRRKLTLLEEELLQTKSKLRRVAQEKSQMERDSRAAISLARSLDTSSNSDMDYYKRKVGELSNLVRSQQNTITELRGQNSTGQKRKSY